MRHYVFCAANIKENRESIKRAKEAVENLEWRYEMDADVTGVYEGSTFKINTKDGKNTSVCVEDNDVDRLIRTCMDFAREQERLKK